MVYTIGTLKPYVANKYYYLVLKIITSTQLNLKTIYKTKKINSQF